MTSRPGRRDSARPDGSVGADVDSVGDDRPVRRDLTSVRVAPDEPLAVIATGPAGAARREVLAALLDVPPTTLPVPDDSYLVARYAPEPARVAFVPGYRQPHTYGADVWAVGPALPRTPRRIELRLPASLLRHLALVGAPDTDGLGVAGSRVLREAAGRGGAVLVVISADQVFTATELDLLTEVARAGLAVFFVVTPGTTGWQAGGEPETGTSERAPTVAADGPPQPVDAPAAGRSARPGSADPPADPVGLAVQAQRAALLAVVPALADAPWWPFRPGDVAALRRALVAWAAEEGPRRLGSAPPAVGHRTVPVATDAGDRDWAVWLERQARSHAQRIRQHLALELAHIHLRVVQEIVFGAGCAALPRVLDREAHALSQLATARCDQAVHRMVADASTLVLGAPPDEATYRRICAAVRTGLAGQRAGRSLERVLLVTSAGDVTEVTGPGALAALDAYPGAPRTAVLPPVAVALAGGCYLHWRGPGSADPGGARSWVQRVQREIDRELHREVTRRMEAVRRALDAVLAEAVDHGILLA